MVSFESAAGKRHFSTSLPTLAGLSVFSAGLKRQPAESWLYIGQSAVRDRRLGRASAGEDSPCTAGIGRPRHASVTSTRQMPMPFVFHIIRILGAKVGEPFTGCQKAIRRLRHAI